MTYATINVRVDQTDKTNFEEFCHNAGLNISVAVNMFIKTVLRTGEIPFKIAAPDPFYSPENQARLRASIDQLNRGEGVAHELIKD